MADLDETGVDMLLRQEWDEALLSALNHPGSLADRAEALDNEIARIETSLRVAYIANGRRGFAPTAMRRLALLRQTFDLLCFLDRHSRDAQLTQRIKELKHAEAAPVENEAT